MATSKEDILKAIEDMSVMDLVDLISDIEIASKDRVRTWLHHLERMHSKSSLGGESGAFDATTTTHSRPFTPLSWKTSRSKRRSSGEGGVCLANYSIQETFPYYLPLFELSPSGIGRLYLEFD